MSHQNNSPQDILSQLSGYASGLTNIANTLRDGLSPEERKALDEKLGGDGALKKNLDNVAKAMANAQAEIDKITKGA